MGQETRREPRDVKQRGADATLAVLAGVAVFFVSFNTTAIGVSAAKAAEPPRGRNPEIVSQGRVVETVDGDTVVLASGTQIRLVGLQAPKLPLGRKGFRAWPLADAAKAALARLVDGKTVRLAYGGARIDRHGRLLAHLFLSDTRDEKVWVQGRMLEQGMARVYSFPDNRARVAEMLALERAARAAKRGIWNHRFYALRKADTVARDIGSFQIVEGRVVAADVVRGRAYLNFGRDWKTDFTISIAPRALRKFRKDWPKIETLAGAQVRVRGWVRKFNGPLIEATHPEQIEVLGD